MSGPQAGHEAGGMAHKVFSTSKDAVISYRHAESEPKAMIILSDSPHRTIAQARDLQQALAQAIAAAELMTVTGETCPAHGVSWDDCPEGSDFLFLGDNMPEISLLEAINGIEKVAREKYDGHYTIMSFTTGYKVIFGTPALDYPAEHERIAAMPIHKTLTAAIINTVLDDVR